jgi:hypothetical protein
MGVLRGISNDFLLNVTVLFVQHRINVSNGSFGSTTITLEIKPVQQAPPLNFSKSFSSFLNPSQFRFVTPSKFRFGESGT